MFRLPCVLRRRVISQVGFCVRAGISLFSTFLYLLSSIFFCTILSLLYSFLSFKFAIGFLTYASTPPPPLHPASDETVNHISFSSYLILILRLSFAYLSSFSSSLTTFNLYITLTLCWSYFSLPRFISLYTSESTCSIFCFLPFWNNILILANIFLYGIWTVFQELGKTAYRLTICAL